MDPALRYVTRAAVTAQRSAFVCVSCRTQLHRFSSSPTSVVRRTASSRVRSSLPSGTDTATSPMWRRQISTSQVRKLEHKNESFKPEDAEKARPDVLASSPNPLPSKADSQRADISRQLATMMDSILARASIAGQHINEYTGTDYSGIDALRKEILEQEGIVKSCILSAEAARSSHHDALAVQTSAQREIVGLLERKQSWSPTDLERYMALVRSEHVNDQAVQKAKEEVGIKERELDDARAKLERLERKRYHEEQIWSDTIRRNSTWVTFGLMGVNIVLLLAQITLFEPHRRRKIVEDVKRALDEKTIAHPLEKEREVEVLEAGKEDVLEELLAPAEEPVSKAEAENLSPAIEAAMDELPVVVARAQEEFKYPHIGTLRDKLKVAEEALRDQFSERKVELRKIDLTAAVLTSAVSGVLLSGIIAVVLRS